MKYKIGDMFTRSDVSTLTGNKTVYTISDILYSVKNHKWYYEYNYYNNSIDSGTCSSCCDKFDKLKSVKLVQNDNN